MENQEPINLPPDNSTPPAPEPAEASPSAPAGPPAAITVTEGKTEREISREVELERERQARRLAETNCSYAEDEARRLKDLQSRPPASPRKPRRPGFTLLHNEAED